MLPPKVVVDLIWSEMPRHLVLEVLFAFTSSSESFVFLRFLACICLSDMLDDTRGCLVCCSFSFNFKVIPSMYKPCAL